MRANLSCRAESSSCFPPCILELLQWPDHSNRVYPSHSHDNSLMRANLAFIAESSSCSLLCVLGSYNNQNRTTEPPPRSRLNYLMRVNHACIAESSSCTLHPRTPTMTRHKSWVHSCAVPCDRIDFRAGKRDSFRDQSSDTTHQQPNQPNLTFPPFQASSIPFSLNP